jgi:hypothetical protein
MNESHEKRMREIQQNQIRIQEEMIRKQREMEDKHMKHMLEIQRKQQEIQDNINKKFNNNQNTGTSNWGANQNSNSTVPSMVWTPVDPNNPSHQHFNK